MAEGENLVRRLLAGQNADGGWSYTKGTSWVEPTAFAALALQACPATGSDKALLPAIQWLETQQQPSGGWSPHHCVDACTSVTSVAALALMPSGSPALQNAIDWTAEHVYRDNFSFSTLVARIMHLPPPHAVGSVPWYPGTAGWVTPTCLSTLALLRGARQFHQPGLLALVRQSCHYLLSRRCPDHGWNHGASPLRTQEAKSYPETTGLALLALRAASVPLPELSLAIARRFAGQPQSLEGLCWIQLALQNAPEASYHSARMPPARTNRDLALQIITLAAAKGKNLLLNT